MIDRNQDELPRALRDAARVLRDTPAPSDEWRRQLMRDIAAVEHPVRVRRWSIRPMTAVAAALACMVVGGAGVAVATRWFPRQPPPVAAAAVAPLSRVRFTLVAPAASRVSIVGDFNQWNPAALPLRRSPDGRTWEVEVPLAPGRYAYSFVVDGALARDPSAPKATDDDFGSPSSVLMVKGS